VSLRIGKSPSSAARVAISSSYTLTVNISGLRRETRTAVSVEEIGAWVQAGFPAATAFRTYTLASVVARHAEITTPSSGESAN